MNADEEALELRMLLARSPRWALLLLDLDLGTVAKMPPLDVDSWSAEERQAARAWASSEGDDAPPACLQRYVDAICARSPN